MTYFYDAIFIPRKTFFFGSIENFHNWCTWEIRIWNNGDYFSRSIERKDGGIYGVNETVWNLNILIDYKMKITRKKGSVP